MKHWLFVSLSILLTSGFVSAQDTAYKALRSVGKQRGEKALSQILSISGQAGRSQPVAWQVLLEDAAARGGVRELQVVSGQIAAERTPVRVDQTSSIPIDLTKLNLDSDGAFAAAEEEATRNRVGFDNADYRLAVDGQGGQPVWTVDLFDYEKRPVGTVRVAADTGALISGSNWVPEKETTEPRHSKSSSDQEFLSPPPESLTDNADNHRPPADYRSSEQEKELPSTEPENHESISERANRYGESVAHFGRSVVHRTTRIFQTVGGWFQKKLTGRNTIDPKQGEDEDDREQTPGPDRYNQPVTPVPPE